MSFFVCLPFFGLGSYRGEWNMKTGNTDVSTIKEISDKRNLHRELWFTYCCVLCTLLAVGLVISEQAATLSDEYAQMAWGELALHGLFLAIISFLVYGGLLYQFTRIGYLKRRLTLKRTSAEELAQIYSGKAPSLTVLIPSYKEDPKVVMQTMMSAAFQEHPNRRIVLCIDDPPNPTKAEDIQLLSSARDLPRQLTEMLAGPRQRMAEAERTFLEKLNHHALEPAAERRNLAALMQEAASWLGELADGYLNASHTDRLFVEQVLRARQYGLTQQAEHISTSGNLDDEQLRLQYRRLASLFDVEITSFERKRYVNLSHEPNKAMNLNSYIGLVGGHYRELRTEQGLLLEPCERNESQLFAPESDYFITLDADSLLLPDYAARLIHFMQQPENARVAVAQTPYSAIPGATNPLERVAGATTDIQYIIHQGFTRFNATYWVGANALIRACALQDIATTSMERGYPVTRYIQDRTVIEDTESSVDLAAQGWQLYNYPERLAYSATPPDFGSLIIQRRRWANGGLIILPKLLRYLFKAPLARLSEAFFRIHYLVSIAAVNIGLIALLSLPFGERLTSLWLPLTALPYFIAYGRDLVLCGYRVSDLFRVYALNLLLIPINLAGVCKSIEQAITGKQIPFGRTPKVTGRTAASPLYILASYALCLNWLIGGAFTLTQGHLPLATFAFLNASFLLYGIAVFIGIDESREDLELAWKTRRTIVLANAQLKTGPAANTAALSASIEEHTLATVTKEAA